VNFIFNFYDFDKDGLISKEDVRVVLSYIPLNLKSSNSNNRKYSNALLKFEKEKFKDRVESQDELFDLLEKCFASAEQLNYANFLSVVENVCSDIFLYILIFLMDKKPFSNTTVKEFKGRKFDCPAIRVNLTPKLQSRLIASPNLNSKFSPSVTIKKSPMMTKRITLDSDGNASKKFGNSGSNSNHIAESKNFLMKFAGANANNIGHNNINNNNTAIDNRGNVEKSGTVNNGELSVNGEKEFVGIGKESVRGIRIKNAVEEDATNNSDDDGIVKNIRVNRKKRNDLKKLEEANVTAKNKFSTMYESSDLPIVPGIKHQALKSSDKLETLK
jgi:hypothetical protein